MGIIINSYSYPICGGFFFLSGNNLTNRFVGVVREFVFVFQFNKQVRAHGRGSWTRGVVCEFVFVFVPDRQ